MAKSHKTKQGSGVKCWLIFTTFLNTLVLEYKNRRSDIIYSEMMIQYYTLNTYVNNTNVIIYAYVNDYQP